MDITLLPTFIVPVLFLVGVSYAGKFFTVWSSARAQGFDKLTSARAGFGLSSSGGESCFSDRSSRCSCYQG